jgi:acetyl esterase/lipase
LLERLKQIMTPRLDIHPVCQEDSVAAAALRSAVAPMKGKLEETGRGLFNDIMEQVAVPAGVTFQAAIAGGISGWWARPLNAQKEAAIVHAHGGWFNWGTAHAYLNFAGHIALSACADVFIPDYLLASEHRFRLPFRTSKHVAERERLKSNFLFRAPRLVQIRQRPVTTMFWSPARKRAKSFRSSCMI